MLPQRQRGTARSRPVTGALQGPSCCANVEAATEGTFIGGQNEDRSSEKGFLLHSTAPSQRRRRARARQPGVWHPPDPCPTGQPPLERGRASQARLQTGCELPPGPRLPSPPRPAEGHGASPESSSQEHACRGAAAAPPAPRTQAADATAPVPRCSQVAASGKRRLRPPRRDPGTSGGCTRQPRASPGCPGKAPAPTSKPQNCRGRAADGCHGVGKFKGHCAAPRKFKYIRPGSSGLRSWRSG